MKKLLLTLIVLVYGFNQATAQRFPITVVPQVNPPAPVNFHNYADGTTINSPLRVQLLLNDLTVTNEQIRLKISFEGNGIAFESRDVVVGASQLFIDGGVPLILTNAELAPYFEFQNIQGINPNIYGQTIPEGSYQFCFEVFDFITGNRFSSKTCATTYIFKNEPPLLNLPLNKVNIEPKEVDNIVFQWTPRQINVSNVEYELSIVEIWDDFVDPQTAFLSAIPFFETTTKATSFVYGPAQPLLLPEKRYAWRVKAKALQGTEEVGLFRNDGNSEIFWFSRTSPCTTPLNVYAEPKGISKINVFWDEDPTIYQEYTIAYREANKPNAQWFTMRTNSGWATVWDLKPGTTYEYKVKGKCKYQYGQFSEIQEITTAKTQDETSNYNCGIVPDEIAISNREPHSGLMIGDRITAGDFVITITEIDSQANGIIKGRGYVGIPYLNLARFGVKFNGILVNTDRQLAQGEIITLYDPEFGEGAEMTVDVDIDISEGVTGDLGELDSQEQVDFVITSITINSNGAIEVNGANGEKDVFPGGRDVQIRDSNGAIWSVGDDGTIIKGQEAEGGAATDDNTVGIIDGEVSEISATGVRIDFQKSGTYYFDNFPEGVDSNTLKDQYQTLAMANGEVYYVPFKAVSDIKGEDVITAKATFSDSSITTNDIVFKTKEGVKISASWEGNIATLSLKKKSGYLIEKILATVKPKETDGKYTVAGAFNLVHLGAEDTKGINVVIVPINGVNITSNIKGQINDIYNKAGVNFTIKVGSRLQLPENVWDVENTNEKLDIGDSSILSYYSPEESAINAYYKANGDYNKEAYYVFLTDLPTTDDSIEGFMPLKSQFAFVFNSTNQSRTIAHELGHGVFGLEHPFVTYETPEKSTDFLMDYTGETLLNHMDWKNMHAPGFKLYWFQDDEEGEYTDSEFADKIFQIIRCAYINSSTNIISFDTSVFGKTGTFYTKWKGDQIWIKIDNGSFEGSSVYEPVELGKNKQENTPWRYSLLYKNVEIYTPRYTTGADPLELLRLREYLFPEDKSTIRDEANKIVKEILEKELLTEEDFEQLKSIANCGIQYFSADVRYKIISKIVKTLEVNGDWLTEYYEDMILDLLETPPSTSVRSYNTEILRLLQDDYILLEKLFKQNQDENAAWLWAGNENNFTRFINAIYKLWDKSSYKDETRYTYIENVLDYTTPRTSQVIHYDGESWFPNVSYGKTNFNKGYITIPADMGNLKGTLKYEYYQPIMVTFEKENISKITVKIPAIFFAGQIKKDNLEKNLEKAELVMEIGLTISGVANFTKLRHLTKLQRLGRITLGTVDVSNSVAGFILKYGDLEYCKQNKEYCQALSTYSTYLSLALFGGGIIEGRIVASRQKAKEAYVKTRSKLDDPEEVKALDDHFGLPSGGGGWLDDISDELLKSDLASNKALKDIFDIASNSQRNSYVKAWEVLKGAETLRVKPDNIKILSRVSERFEYRESSLFDGLKKLMAEGSPASKKRLIEGLNEVDKIFDASWPVTFSGIKNGEVKVISVIDGTKVEIARINREKEFIKKKFLNENEGAEVVGKHNGVDILRKGDKEVGFRISNAEDMLVKLQKTPDLQKRFNELDNTLKPQFVEDFADVSDDVIKKLQDENLFDAWKNNVRSADLDVLRNSISKSNLRNEYDGLVTALAQEKTKLLSEGKTIEEVAKVVFEKRRSLTIEYKGITPDDMLELIFKRNDILYTQSGKGDKWGATFDGLFNSIAAKKGIDISSATQSQLDEIYDAIANGASKTAGEDKYKLGNALYKFFEEKVTTGQISKKEFDHFVEILYKYRMK
ncbi:fibronectin type III domain-containing protein [Aquimarina mytili]|uniref:Fibronectin type III domain-containing protein n=1 Tax=Aquimarina mytili TaxID=874423 RepID=A0A937A0D0_9FLAO|nr:fibronectin type III domain-containing protein [Aquimarina mytili]MBL0682715.1 fibronectin type III domain-containing protein [Aquimarina mytili]